MMPPQDAQDKERRTTPHIYFSPPGHQPSPYRNQDVFENLSSVFKHLAIHLFLLLSKRKEKKNQTKTFLYARCIEILNSVLYTLTPVKCVVCKFVRDQFPKCRISLWFGGENETHMFNNSNNYISLFLLLITLFFSFP